MRFNLVLLCLGLVAARVQAAPPEFDGVMTSQGLTYFAVRPDAVVAMRWIKLGDVADGYTLKSYDKTTETLTLVRNAESIQVVLKTGSVRPAPRAKPTIDLLSHVIEKGDISQQVALDLLTNLRDRRDDSARKLVEVEARAAKEPEPKRTELVREHRRKLELEESNLEYYTDEVIAHWRDETRSSK